MTSSARPAGLDAAAAPPSNARMAPERFVVDAHTHAFPDALAARAIPRLERQANISAALDGTVGALLRSMDRAGIAAAVVCSIATDPGQFGPIMAWSRTIAGPRLFPFPSVHPGSSRAVEEVRQVAAAGFGVVKIKRVY